MIPNLFPAELRGRSQWMAAGSGDPSQPDFKRPISPKTGRWGSPTNPAEWGTFEEAMAMGYPLVGYCFHESDDYAVIDLDTYKATNDDVRSLHREIIRFAEGTYRELSQSGQGTHIIGLGRLEAGAHNVANALEMYSHARFMICTGKHEAGVAIEPIADIQPLLDHLYERHKAAGAGSINWRDLDAGEESDMSDAELIEKACSASNEGADRFNQLCRGDMSAYSGDHSVADMAFVQHLCYYTKDNQQVARVFFHSPLAKREKASRLDYLPRTIVRARKMIENDAPPPVDATKLLERAQAAIDAAATPLQGPPLQGEDSAQPALALALPAVEASDTPFPPGLIGDVARYVLGASIRPAHDVALVTAISVVAGIVARNFNISNSGLNMYILLLAKTGTGKESVQSSIDRLFNEVTKRNPAAGDRFLGPAKFSSGPALIKRFAEQPCFMSVQGEFGITLKNMISPRANAADKTLMQALLDLFSKSGWGQMLRSSVYSDKEKNTAVVHAPALTLMCETAPEPFFAGLDETAIESGFLPRFLCVEHMGDRPPRNRDAWSLPPEQLVQDVTALCTTVLQMEQNHACTVVEMDATATAMLDEFDVWVDQRMIGSSETVRQLWNRAHLKALRLAALVAVGVNPYKPVVTAVEAQWAADLVRRDVNTLHSRFMTGDVGEGDGKQRADLVKVITKYMADGPRAFHDYHAKGCIPGRGIQQMTAARASFKNDRRGANKALKELIQTMIEAGELAIVPKEQAFDWFKTRGAVYCLGDMWAK